MRSIDEIKAIMSVEPEEGVEDNRLNEVYGELEERDIKIGDLEDKIVELTSKVSDMAEANAKLVEQIKYVEPEETEKEDEPEVEFADLSEIYKKED